MMDLKALRRLVNEGEHEQLEFKRKVTHPEKIVREIVAFANTKGGSLLIGVDDNGSIPGLKYPEDDQYSLNKAIEEMIKPRIQYSCELIPLDETESKAVLHYRIKEGLKKPYAVLLPGEASGKAYVRVSDRSIQASREVREIIRRKDTPKSAAIQIGQKEKQLFQLLEEQGHITVAQLAQASGVNKRLASRTLVLLTLHNVLRVEASDKEDRFYMNEPILED
jgi:predicted HTH transcriptional regulator